MAMKIGGEWSGEASAKVLNLIVPSSPSCSFCSHRRIHPRSTTLHVRDDGDATGSSIYPDLCPLRHRACLFIVYCDCFCVLVWRIVDMSRRCDSFWQVSAYYKPSHRRIPYNPTSHTPGRSRCSCMHFGSATRSTF